MKKQQKAKKNIFQKIWHFTDVSKAKSSSIYHLSMGAIIAISAMLAFWGMLIPHVLEDFEIQIEWFERIVLVIFTAEFVIRILCSPSKRKFVIDKFNIIDFIAVAPFYMGIESTVILRMFRIFRLTRLWKTTARIHFFEMLRIRGGILEKVTPMVLGLLFIKYIIITMEQGGWWIVETNLSSLFTIVGFALGVVLSQKIGTSYGKYRELEASMAELYGILSSVVFYMNQMKKGVGHKAGICWVENFLKIYEGPDKNSLRALVKANEKFYTDAAEIGNTNMIPHHRLAALLEKVFSESIVILSNKSNYTPVAYDRLLLQVTMMYLMMVAIFVPGLAGALTVLVSSYLLYGMYYVTQEMDFALSGDKNAMIILKPNRLHNYLELLKSEKTPAKTPVKKVVKKVK